MKLLIPAITVFLFLASCNNSNTSAIKGLLSEQNLTAQFFNVNIDADTTLLTKSGCVIKIPKGAIASSSNNVKIEIKEALNNTDIILAGLNTMSGKRPLSSGGMIYFNAASGYSIEIKKQIEVLVPTKNYNRDMQVFKGDTVNGKIDWSAPEALPQDSTIAKVDAGKALFLSNCASCHKVDKEFTGPALYGITDRLPWGLVYTLTVHDRRILDGGCMDGGEDAHWTNIGDTGHLKYWRVDADKKLHENKMPQTVRACLYHRCLQKRYSGEMTSFPILTEKDVTNIYAYVKSESNKRPELKEKFVYNCCDSCVDYAEASFGLTAQREKLKDDNGAFFTLDREITVPSAATENYIPDIAAQQPYTKVSPTSVKATYYTINIKTVGWYNIDMLMKSYNNCIESELFVRLQGSYEIDVNLNLIIPQYKAFVEGGKLSDGKQYGFDELDGKIMLPQNVRAYIIAFAEKGDKLIFAKKEFNTQTKQIIELEFTEISKQQLKAEIMALKLDDINADVKDSEHADEIRDIDKKIKSADSLKPKNCNCDFLNSSAPATDVLK